MLRNGRIEQIGTPLQLYDRPINAFVAGFIGSPAMNLIRGNLHISEHASCVLTEEGFEPPIQNISSRARQAQSVIYGARPEHLRIVEQAGLEARVLVIEPTGSETHFAARLGNSDILISQRERFCQDIGSPIRILSIVEQAHLFDADTGQRLN